MFDAHAHLHDPAVLPFLDDVVSASLKVGVGQLCNCATSPNDWLDTYALPELAAGLRVISGYGVHPWYAGTLPSGWLDELELYLRQDPSAVLGEIGLDGIRDDAAPALQEKVLKEQLALAVRHGRPVVLHGARAWGDLVKVLRSAPQLPGFVAHGFGGSLEIMRLLVEMGGYISFAGSVCNRRAVRVRAAARETPLERLLVESDAPAMFPMGGTPVAGAHPDTPPLNQPCNLVLIARTIAELRGMTFEEVAAITYRNARQILDPRTGAI